MIGKASEIKVHSLNWWPSLELNKPNLEDMLQKWLSLHPELVVVQITFHLEKTHKQAIIIYKEATE